MVDLDVKPILPRTPSPSPSKKRKTAPKSKAKPDAKPPTKPAASSLGGGRARLAEEVVALGIAAAQANSATLVEKVS